FRQVDPTKLKGTLVGVPGLNAISIPMDRRRFPDEEDLNRLFPGKENGDESQQYAWRIFNKIVRHFDYHIDLHTASFGRINSLYVRSDIYNDTLMQMARLQDADIILHNEGKPSAGQVVAASRTLRAEAMLAGIHSITVEYGDPQVYQPEMIERGV
ncbi:MAG: succinylglutamate desuccinylase/aspartoacylase family protein, partial [Phaeodactylibacter sp.]|nr:succinylglutamate desuccinylase/aspartoacylase family protein [Phaeodactylibacter sp.]